MHKRILKTRAILRNYFTKRKSFRYEDLIKDIKNQNGFLRVSPHTTVKEYIATLEEIKVIFYDEKQNIYYFPK